MKELVSKSSGFTRIEFWALSTICVFVLFIFITDGLDGSSALNNNPYKGQFERANVPFYFYYNYFIPQLIRHLFQFSAFLYLNFIVIPKLLVREALLKNVLLAVAIFLLAGVVFGVTDTYFKGYLYTNNSHSNAVDQAIFVVSFHHAFKLVWSLAIYTVIKYCAIYLVINADDIHTRFKFFTREGIIAIAIWLVGLFMLVLMEVQIAIVISWMLVVLSAIMLYLYSFHTLIPRSFGKRYYFGSYLLKCIIVLAVAFGLVLLLLLGLFHDGDGAVSLAFFNTFFQLFITVPITWTLYKRKMKGNEEISYLKKELRQTTANIDFLRSQINPHFLFNALNTLYGTAIQENAERTGEGIQMLGDMMRFMLQENMQEKISLSREIDYLNNYISLQRLRTDPAPNIDIKTAIQDRENLFQVAPMLLIPFVENAFKHGISFREPSHIKITLEIKDKTLYFDVYNSKHPKPQNDPEKDKSGVGLENVKQRLRLLYPNKHELIIRETGREFFIHLTLQLA
jgi:two-component system, LytTR family, sensor kinase